ncbi:hypothetical protein [Cognatitamlana onchidii]|uniref:hypothetical protein n=1 Tax=Cognatitamlana onchidii TaxID=2562860 RepID=UPI0010A5E43F|nr:hypothetical protein [Algibacter onchidii]
MTIENLIGNYRLSGTNQDNSGNTYTGTLKLSIDSNNRILAEWIINKEQKQKGIGFFKDDILVINFSYWGEDRLKYYGVVVYRCLNNNILDGFWSEDLGDPNFLGTERCFKADSFQLLD